MVLSLPVEFHISLSGYNILLEILVHCSCDVTSITGLYAMYMEFDELVIVYYVDK